MLPISTVIRAREREYVDCLSAFRTDSPGDAIAALDEWVCYFAAVAEEACEHVRSVQEKVWALDALLEEKAGGLRSGSSAQRILPLLREQPVVTAAFIADHLGVSRVAAHCAVERLVDRGILVPGTGRYRRSEVFRSDDVLRVLDGEF
ncbi:HTH domain-containing protein [Brachybacterium alimentarium]|uniref:HTH domain-containing protein n=1 Tax=Brachybacterium alimentarium TaxID=47845 RepID=UPI001596C576|nr:HTH domain-containing protein [Brachybacterium alimentarium]